MSDDIPPIPDVPAAIREAAQLGRLVPFVGGASKLAGCPDWTELADDALKVPKFLSSLYSPPRKLTVVIATRKGFSVDSIGVLSWRCATSDALDRTCRGKRCAWPNLGDPVLAHDPTH